MTPQEGAIPPGADLRRLGNVKAPTCFRGSKNGATFWVPAPAFPPAGALKRSQALACRKTNAFTHPAQENGITVAGDNPVCIVVILTVRCEGGRVHIKPKSVH